ncbi:MAG: efflux RND transporter permease subunit [bacterium]
MNVANVLMSRRRLVLTTAILLALAGLIAWFTMPREEDPRMKNRFGQIITVFPGADTLTMERLVVKPLDDHISEVAAVKHLTTIRQGVVISVVELRDATDGNDIDFAWDEVQRAINEASTEFPAGTLQPELTRDIVQRQEGVLLAVTGSADVHRLDDASERLERALLAIPDVARVQRVGRPGEQVLVEFDDVAARRLGVDALQLVAALKSRNVTIPAGSVQAGSRVIPMLPHADFASVEEIAATPIPTATGAVALSQVATVRMSAEEPRSEIMRFQGMEAVGLGVIGRPGIDAVRLGDEIRAVLAVQQAALKPLDIHVVTFQPDRVHARLDELGRSLLMGIAIVVAILVLAMGLRVGSMVGIIVPLVAFASLAIYAFTGGVLHQISIAALVLALGLLVDNAIVMVEAIQAHLDAGKSRVEAASAAVRELALPLGSATGTTLAAFVPMLASSGPTADFTRSIPVVIMLTIAMSYVFSISVAPALASLTLKANPNAAESLWERWMRAFAPMTHRRPVFVLAAATALVVMSGVLAGSIKQQFFPGADRNQFVVSVEMPEGTHIRATDDTAKRVERQILEQSGVQHVATFIGRSTPQFYYNLNREPNAPHIGQFIVTTHDLADVQPTMDALRTWASANAPEARIEVRNLEQGPPVRAPIEVRLFGESLSELQQAAETLTAELRQIPGAVDVRNTVGVGSPSLRLEVQDATATAAGASRELVTLALLRQTTGVDAGQYRGGMDPMPIRVRSSSGDQTPVEGIGAIDVAAPGAPPIPLAGLATQVVQFLPASIDHRDRKRMVVVRANLAKGAAFNEVLDQLAPKIDALPGIKTGRLTFEYGGAAEGSGQANASILAAVPLGLMMLLFFLLAEFNSFRRVLIILSTVPLAATGVVPGLLLAGQPFGFMSMLGVIALVGIVVNNAIVLIDLVDARRAEGASIPDALTEAVARRARPILLTTATTVAGLIPLVMSPTTLWPPLASAMMSGLVASTMLTLVVVPSLYRLMFREDR